MSQSAIADRGFFASVPRLVRLGYRAGNAKLSIPQKWLYACLKDLCGDQNTCYRTLRNLAEEAGLSLAVVCEAIPILANAGLIKAEKKRRSTGGKETWHIQIVDIWPQNVQLYPVRSPHEQSSNEQQNVRHTNNPDENNERSGGEQQAVNVRVANKQQLVSGKRSSSEQTTANNVRPANKLLQECSASGQTQDNVRVANKNVQLANEKAPVCSASEPECSPGITKGDKEKEIILEGKKEGDAHAPASQITARHIDPPAPSLSLSLKNSSLSYSPREQQPTTVAISPSDGGGARDHGGPTVPKMETVASGDNELLSQLTDEQSDFWIRWCAISQTKPDSMNLTAYNRVLALASDVTTTEMLQDIYNVAYERIRSLVAAKGGPLVPPRLGNMEAVLPEWKAARQQKAREREEASKPRFASGTGATRNFTQEYAAAKLPPLTYAPPPPRKPRQTNKPVEKMDFSFILAHRKSPVASGASV